MKTMANRYKNWLTETYEKAASYSEHSKARGQNLLALSIGFIATHEVYRLSEGINLPEQSHYGIAAMGNATALMVFIESSRFGWAIGRDIKNRKAAEAVLQQSSALSAEPVR